MESLTVPSGETAFAGYRIALKPLPGGIRRGRQLAVAGSVSTLDGALPRLWQGRFPLKVGIELRGGPERQVVTAARWDIRRQAGLALGSAVQFECLLDTSHCPPGEAIVAVDLLYENFGWLRNNGGKGKNVAIAVEAGGDFREINLADVDTGADSEFEIRRGELRFDCQLEVLPGSDRLIVPLRPFSRQPEERPPVFLDWPRDFAGRANILRICDPTLFLSDTLQLGSFFGRDNADPIDGVIEITQAVATKLGVAPDRILFFGMSGGGMAALMSAMRYQGTAGLACNAQIDARPFAGAGFAREIGRIFHPGADLTWVCDNFPQRTSVLSRYEAVSRDGYTPRVTLLQNISDDRHYREHFEVFCRAAGISSASGMDASGRMRAIAYNAPGGHATMPGDDLVLAEALRLLDLPPGPAIRP